MRIIVVPSWFPSPAAPLNGIFFAEQTELLARHASDVEVHVFAAFERNFELPLRRPHVAAKVLASWWRAEKYSVATRSANYFVHRFETPVWSDRVTFGGLTYEARRMYRVSQALIRSRGPVDLVHAHVCHPGGFVGARLARLLGVPFVLGEHISPFPFDDLLGADGEPRPEVLLPVREARRVTTPSRAHAREVQRFVDRPIDVVPNFIDETRFTPGDGPRHDPLRLISVGHLVPQKGYDLLLRALALCRARGLAVELTIVGDGYERDALRALAEELGVADAVTWAGAPPRDTVPALYRAADAFVLASRHESFGIVVIEALASGLPVVATACGGPEDIVSDECGLLVPPEDAPALADGIARLAERDFDRAAIRRYFESTFSAAAVVPRIEALYREVVSTPQPASRAG